MNAFNALLAFFIVGANVQLNSQAYPMPRSVLTTMTAMNQDVSYAKPATPYRRKRLTPAEIVGKSPQGHIHAIEPNKRPEVTALELFVDIVNIMRKKESHEKATSWLCRCGFEEGRFKLLQRCDPALVNYDWPGHEVEGVSDTMNRGDVLETATKPQLPERYTWL